MSYKIEILERFIEGETLTSCDFRWSNSNQYFRKIKNDGIVLNEVNIKNKKNKNFHFERSLDQDQKNVENAKKLLIHYKTKSRSLIPHSSPVNVI